MTFQNFDLNIEYQSKLNYSKSQFMKKQKQTQKISFQQQVKLNNFHKEFKIMESPQIINRICQIRHTEYINKDRQNNQFRIQNLLKTVKGPTIKKISDNRQKYRQIKDKIANSMKSINKIKQNLTLSQILLWKQDILTNFLNQFLFEISKECKQKSQILIFIWNSIFNVIQYLFEIITKMSQNEQKRYLNNLLSNHTSYQSIIQNLKLKLNKKEEERKQQEQFISALVYNLRYKRKEIKKLTKNLKMCTVKLNQFKDFYLDLQLQHIELLSENRQISKENALNLLKRKQQINHEKRKEYKLKQSHKKIRFQIQNQIEHENVNEEENVNKLNDQLKTAFNKYYHQKNKKHKKGSFHNITQNIFENALDDFNVRIDEVPETESIIDFKNNIAFMDVGTDMTDFVLDVEDRQVQITFNDRLFEDMICHASVQTAQIKPKQKILEEISIQVDQIQLKGLKLSKHRVIDRSFIFSDYRDQRYKNEKVLGLKIKTEQHLKSLKEIHNEIGKKSMKQIVVEEDSDEDNKNKSIKIQTDEVLLFSCHNIPRQYRNFQFEKQIQIYFAAMNRLSQKKQNNNQEDDDLMSKTSPNIRSKQWMKGKLGHRLLNSTSDFSEMRSSYKSASGDRKLSKTLRSSKISTMRTNLSKNNSIYQSSKNISPLSSNRNIKRVSLKKQFQTINQTNYEQMQSNQLNREARLSRFAYSSFQNGGMDKKFWVNKRKGDQKLTQDKKNFLNDLSKSEQLFNKSNLNWSSQNYQQNKKILMDLDKMSEQLETNKLSFELLQDNINQNMNILKEQLKKMLMKKRNNRKLAMSRQQSLCKIISLVYTYAYHLYFNHQRPIQNLIIPLFHYFKIGYGQIKKNDLYLRMLYFLSQTICHKDECYIYDTFILFLGLSLNDDQKLKIGKQNTCLYLHLLNGLSINFKFPLNVEQLYTTLGHLQKKCKQILLGYNYEINTIDKVIQRVKLKLHSLVNSSQQPQSSIETKDYSDTKLNVFKCCHFIIQEIEKIKSIIYDSYINLYEYFKQFEHLRQQGFIKYVLDNMYLPQIDYDSKLDAINNYMAKNTQDNWLYNLVNIFLQLNIPDFNKIYFFALSKYKIKEQFLYLSINRRLNFLVKYVEINRQQFHSQYYLINHIIHKEEKSILKQLTNKKILALTYLQIVEHQTKPLLNNVLGQNLQYLYGLPALKTDIF